MAWGERLQDARLSRKLTGGSDRSELRPLKATGQIDHDLAGHEIVGNHKGQHAAYNIVDPAPGTVHEFANRGDVLGCRQRGWWPARPEDGRPAYAVASLYQTDPSVPLTPDETSAPFAGMVHMVTSEANYGRLMREQAEARHAQLGPAGLSFLESATADEQSLSRRGNPLATRFMTKDHGFYDDNDRPIEGLNPRGILREEDL